MLLFRQTTFSDGYIKVFRNFFKFIGMDRISLPVGGIDFYNVPLLIGDFKINLAMIAAFLTLIGYSLNDTIVIFDRIRENRGKARQLNPQTITNSINQTISRTILTSFTTFIVVLIMYIFGGQGLRGFTFAIGFGIIIGTYSSVAIAAPILLLGAKTKTVQSKKSR